jgi:deferrochelatase/peroxidase EfeB
VAYGVPGGADRVDGEIVDRWNEEVAASHRALGELHTRFCATHPGALGRDATTLAVRWPADPREPNFCLDGDAVRELCDWGARGRQVLQNEYCEYAVVQRADASGRLRPKRVQVTTELREYWLTLATHDPDALRAAAADVLGEEPRWTELYGVPDPGRLSPAERRVQFAVTMAGHGGDPELEAAGVPAAPVGSLNAENAVFMTHPINGLDDLLFVVLLGARRFAVRDADGALRRAEEGEIFASRRHLACRHGDPVAVLAAYQAVLDSRAVAFADPLGVYIAPLNREVFQIGGETIPAEWVRWGRGREGTFQRLEFGPGDEDDAFLDEIEVLSGQERAPLTGGHQLLERLEVGPLLATAATEPASEDELVVLPAAEPIDCLAAVDCGRIRRLAAERRRAGGADGGPPPSEERPSAGPGALQEGIAHAPGSQPGKFLALMFLRAANGCDAARAGERLADLWRLYAGLKQGRIRDLEPARVPHEEDDLRVLLGLGPGAFALHGSRMPRPAALSPDQLFLSPDAAGGGPLLAGAGLEYAPEVRANPAAADICVQVTGDTKVAVDRTVVETWKLLADAAGRTGTVDLEPTAFYLGFQRSDHRSWIDFHDGLSNMRSSERAAAITIDAGEDEWCRGGTYLGFVRIAVDLPAWRRLGRREQELLVGRDKLSGCPIVSLDAAGEPVTEPGCPVTGSEIWETANDPLFAEPPPTADPALAQSHVQRANHHREPANDPGTRRIFRQGYEFLEWRDGAPGFSAGLNFVSFQDTPERLTRLLTAEGWLGRVNFGGDPDRQPPGMEGLLSVYAAGVFLVPPRRAGELFPGASAFGG